jgi:hypothetical protein
MIAKTLTDAGNIKYNVNIVGLKLAGGANSGMHQNARIIQRTGGQDDFL